MQPLHRSTYSIDVEEFHRLRTLLGMSINALAERSGVDSRTIYRAIEGKRIALENIAKIAQKLNTTPIALITGEPPTALELRLTKGPVRGVSAVTVIESNDFATLDESTAPDEMLRVIADAIKNKKQVVILSVKPGNSIHWKIAFESRTDMHHFVEAFCKYKFVDRQIYEIHVPELRDPVSIMRLSAEAIDVRYTKDFNQRFLTANEFVIDCGSTHITECYRIKDSLHGFALFLTNDEHGQPRDFALEDRMSLATKGRTRTSRTRSQRSQPPT